MNPSEDPSDRLVDSLLREQARSAPDEVLLRAISSKLQAKPSVRARPRNLDFFWPAAAAAVVLLAAAGLFWNGGDDAAAVIDDRGLAVRDQPVEPAEEGGDPLLSDGDGDLPRMGAPKPVAGDGSTAVEADPARLLDSLRFILEEDTVWYVQFGFESDGKWAPNLIGKTPEGGLLKNRVSASDMISPGDVFFQNGAFAGRFKFLGFVERELVNNRTQLVQLARFAQFEDLKPNKMGDRYESQMSLPRAQLNESAYHDRTAVLELAMPGLEAVEFKVEERTWFALPPAAGEKRYYLKEVTPDRIGVEMEEPGGARVTRMIAKSQDG